MAVYTPKRPTYKATFDLARRLSPRDRRRLLSELAKLSGVKLVSPNKTARAIQTGRNLADQVRRELQLTKTRSLDETMRQLRGR
ncbi:MAG: hypothetical protein AB1750_20870, partial [Chloroflexota bacterium]